VAKVKSYGSVCTRNGTYNTVFIDSVIDERAVCSQLAAALTCLSLLQSTPSSEETTFPKSLISVSSACHCHLVAARKRGQPGAAAAAAAAAAAGA
jgi:D-serine deaminase-like pyridoxal phosphate-dependent protein